jgi:hypothetical protein
VAFRVSNLVDIRVARHSAVRLLSQLYRYHLENGMEGSSFFFTAIPGVSGVWHWVGRLTGKRAPYRKEHHILDTGSSIEREREREREREYSTKQYIYQSTFIRWSLGTTGTFIS